MTKAERAVGATEAPAPSRRLLLRGGVFALSASVLAACGRSDDKKGDKADGGSLGAAKGSSSQYFKPGERNLTPTLKGTTLEGEHVDIADMRDHVVVINVWGSWCAPCRKEAPELVRLAKHTESMGVRFLGIDNRDNKAAARAFERNYGVTYPSIFDPGGRAVAGFRQLAPRAVPTTYVLDKSGRVAAMSIGPLTYRDFYPIIKAIAAES